MNHPASSKRSTPYAVRYTLYEGYLRAYKALYLRAYKALYLRAYKALHLSRTLYKSALFMQNKPNFQKTKMNTNSFKTKDYENIWQPGVRKNKPNPSGLRCLLRICRTDQTQSQTGHEFINRMKTKESL